MKVWEEYESKGLTILALSDEASGTVEKHIEQHGMTFPIGTGAKGKGAYGVSGIPAAFLIDHTGTIVWQGHPGSADWEGMLDKALENAERMADQWRIGEHPKFLNKAAALAAKGEMGKVWKESESLLKRFSEDPLKLGEVRNFQEKFGVRVNAQNDYIATLGKDGCYQEASNYIEARIKVYKGAPAADEWTALLKTWKKDTEIKSLMKLDKNRLSALEQAFEGDADKAKKSLRSLMKKARGTAISAAMESAYNLVSGI